MSNKKAHRFLLNELGAILEESGDLFQIDIIKELSPRLLCPILNSIFPELKKLKPEKSIFIPAVNLSNKWVNGYFDYFLTKKENGIVQWDIKDTTESNNNKLIRLQPEMEQRLREETSNFLDSDLNCDITK